MNGEDFEHKLQKLLLHNGFKVDENNDVKVTTVWLLVSNKIKCKQVKLTNFCQHK